MTGNKDNLKDFHEGIEGHATLAGSSQSTRDIECLWNSKPK